MNWLITGGCGFIGRALIRHLNRLVGHRIRVFDNLSVGTREDLAGCGVFAELDPVVGADWSAELTLMVGDILDADALSDAVKGADIVVHLAANTGVAPSVEDPMADCTTNVIGTLNVLDATRSEGRARVVFASSGAPLGVQEPPLHEDMAPHPASPYGASKLAGEGYCSAYFHCFGIETVTLRFGNVYGPGSSKKASVVAKFIKQALAGETLEIYGDGSQTRDFIFIDDLVQAILQAANRPGIGGEVFQIATAKETTVGEMADLLCSAFSAVTGHRPTVFNGQDRQGDVHRNFSDTRKAQARLGWSAQVPLDEGLHRTVVHFAGLDGQETP